MACLNEINDRHAASNGALSDLREMPVIAICAGLFELNPQRVH
jgi:hypothetical protein